MYIYIQQCLKTCKRTKTHNDNTNKTTSAGTKKNKLSQNEWRPEKNINR